VFKYSSARRHGICELANAVVAFVADDGSPSSVFQKPRKFMHYIENVILASRSRARRCQLRVVWCYVNCQPFRSFSQLCC